MQIRTTVLTVENCIRLYSAIDAKEHLIPPVAKERKTQYEAFLKMPFNTILIPTFRSGEATK